ncbi:MAG: hypothetical protein R3B48_20145 [Kofleriaceae bacterium]
MAGWLETTDGQRHSFHLRLDVRAASTWTHLRDGRAELRGVAHAPPFTRAADATGAIWIRPIGQRLIRYEVSFPADDGRILTFRGQKNIRWRAARRTLTELDGELTDERGDEVAVCHLAFDLRRDWLSFARSFHRTA